MSGIEIHQNTENALEANYSDMSDKVKGILNTWSKRKLSLMDKVQLVNSLIALLFVYKMLVLPRILENVIQQIDQQIQTFLWNGAKPKILLSMLKLNKESGGLKLVDLAKKDIPLKTARKSILENVTNYTKIYSLFVHSLNVEIWQCNINTKDIEIIVSRNKNPFWPDMLYAWSKYHEMENIPRNKNFLWFNSEIRISDKPFFWEKAYNHGLKYVAQLYRNGVLRSVLEHNNDGVEQSSFSDTKIVECQTSSIGFAIRSSKSYMALTMNLEALRKKCLAWEKELNVEIDYSTFSNCFKGIYKVTNVPKLRSF